MNEQKKIKRIRVSTFILGGIAVASVLFVAFTVYVYCVPRNSVSVRIRNIFPYPAVIVNGTHPIAFRTVDSDIVSIRRFYESQSDDLSKAGLRIDFSTPDGEKRLIIREKELLNKLVEDAAIKILAQERNITITGDAVNQTVEQKINAFGNSKDEVSKQLNHLYGWTMTDFEQKIVQPEIYKDELSKVYMQGMDISSHAKKNIEDASNDLAHGVSFEDVAKKYSEGRTAQDGGELGFIPVSTLAPEVKQVIQKQRINQVGDIVESPLGFHIVAVEEKKQEQGQDMVRLKQIFTRKITFSDWLADQMKRMSIIVLYKGYMWDKETARIEFKQPEMKSFEENVVQKSQGDASMLF